MTKGIITDNPEHWKIIKKCATEHGDMLERVTTNGMTCLKCLYTIINGEYKPL